MEAFIKSKNKNVSPREFNSSAIKVLWSSGSDGLFVLDVKACTGYCWSLCSKATERLLYKDLNMMWWCCWGLTVKDFFFQNMSFLFNAPHHDWCVHVGVHVRSTLTLFYVFDLDSSRKTGNTHLTSPLNAAIITLRSPPRPPALLRAHLFSHTPAHAPHCSPQCPHCLKKRRTHLKIWTVHPALPVQWVHTSVT